MSLYLSIIRPIASVILALVVFFGLLIFVLINTVRGNLLDPGFYKDNLAKNDVYERFYTEVLLDPEFDDEAENLLGDFDVSREDIVTVAREILPPAYLQDQVETGLDGVTDYLNGDSRDPNLFIDLGPPLDHIEPALFRYIDRRIDALDEIPVNTFEELEQEVETLFRTVEDGKIPASVPSIQNPEVLANRYVDTQVAQLEEAPVSTVEEFETELNEIYTTLLRGEIPSRVPSVESIPGDDRNEAFDNALKTLREEETIPREAIQGLEEREEQIKERLAEADVQGALQVATSPLIELVTGLFIDDVYDRAVESLRRDGSIPQEALDGLDQRKDAIKEHLGDGDFKEALKLGARGLGKPLMDTAIRDIAAGLDREKRLDIIAEAARENGQNRQEFLDSLQPTRDAIDRGGLGIVVAIVIVIAGLILMAVVQIPRMASALRWPGLTVFLSGLGLLTIGLVAKAQLPGRFDNLLDKSNAGDIPPSLIQIITDVLDSMAQEIASGFVTPAITITIIGLALLAASFFVRRLPIPGLAR